MSSHQLDRSIPIPLYYQMKQWLMSEIEKGIYKPGQIIPSERELSEQFQISRMTVRQALKELMNEGHLIREQGKGTFIAEPKLNQRLSQLTSFSEDMRNRGLEPDAQVLETSVINHAPAHVSIALHLDGDHTILKIKRLRLANKQPMAIETSFLPLSLFSGLEKKNFTSESIYRVLENEFALQLLFAKQTIEAGFPTKDEEHLLGISKGTSVMRIERVTYMQEGIPFEFVSSVYRGDRYKFEMELHR